jgi:hypothetical protein
MTRLIEAEILDELPADDPLAVGSRRDLRRINSWMGNVRIMAGILEREFQNRAPGSLMELGAGDGSFLADLSSRMGERWRGTSAALLDRSSCMSQGASGELERNGWEIKTIRSDVFDWVKASTGEQPGVVMCNLFLHHFSDAELKALFEGIARRTNVFIGIEPRRNGLGLWSSRLVGLIGCNRVTRHDAPVSVRAGFSGKELSGVWPAREGWILEEKPAGWCSHLFIARRAHAGFGVPPLGGRGEIRNSPPKEGTPNGIPI